MQQQQAEYPVLSLPPSATPTQAMLMHWREYAMEAVELGTFMLAACMFGTLFFYTESPVTRHIPPQPIRLVFMGVAMGMTAIVIILSPFGRRSGAHFNPAVSFTFFCLGKMHWLDALFYALAQFLGGICGVFVAHGLLGARLADSSVRYVVTTPGHYGLAAAFAAECFMGILTMTVVLRSSNHPVLSRFTWLLVGLLVAAYVIAFSPVSGFSLNPARTISSAVFAGTWTAMWLYLSAPLLGMLIGAGLYVLTSGSQAIYCGKIYHDLHSACPFRCHFGEFTKSGRSSCAHR